MTVYQFLYDLHKVCHFQTRERGHGEASKSELRRWFERNCIQVNGKPAKLNDPEPDEWESLVLFPKNRNKVTLW